MPVSAADAPDRCGEVVAGYRLGDRLWRSRISTVYHGRRLDDGRPVAIKALGRRLARDPGQLERFRSEARWGRALGGGRFAEVLELIEADDEALLVMERLEGWTLREVMAGSRPDRRLPALLWAHLIAQAAEGLEALHQLPGLELVHRDVSPANLFVTRAGEVKVLDLGLVRPAETVREPPPVEQLSGTVAYLAPERLEPGGRVDRRSDLFSLGVVLYEATTLQRLFAGATAAQSAARVRRHRVPPPHRLVADYPRRLEGVVLWTLRREPEGRPSSAAELCRALDRLVAGQGNAPPSAEIVVRAITHVLEGPDDDEAGG